MDGKGAAGNSPAGGLRDYTVLPTSSIVEFFTKIRERRERIAAYRAVARIGWRPCRPVLFPLGGLAANALEWAG